MYARRIGTCRQLGLAGAAALVLLIGVAPAWGAVTPTFYTTASPGSPVGFQIFDHANLMASARGTITFRLYAPGDTSCQTPVFTSTVVVSGSGSDNSATYTTPAAGTYQWAASYSGDANDNPISSVCGAPSQSVIVDKRSPVGSTTTATSGAGQIEATTTLAGGFAPLGGTLTFTVTGPNDQWCARAAVYTRTVPVTGAGSYQSGWFTPTAAGTYTYRIRYSGDANNLGVGPSNCIDQNASITLTQSQIAAPGPPPSPTGPGPTPPPPTGPGATGGTTTPAGTTPPAAGTKPAAGTTPTTGAGGSASTPTPRADPAAAGPVFRGPARCVRGPFRVYVAGAAITRVSYFIRGRRLRTVTRADSRGRFATTVAPRGLRPGTGARLTAKVAGAGGLRVLHRTFTVCI